MKIVMETAMEWRIALLQLWRETKQTNNLYQLWSLRTNTLNYLTLWTGLSWMRWFSYWS